jgi:regulator of replication initiation timing
LRQLDNLNEAYSRAYTFDKLILKLTFKNKPEIVTVSKEVEEVKAVVEVKDLMKNNIKIHQTKIEIKNLRNKLTHIIEKEEAMKTIVEELINSQRT